MIFPWLRVYPAIARLDDIENNQSWNHVVWGFTVSTLCQDPLSCVKAVYVSLLNIKSNYFTHNSNLHLKSSLTSPKSNLGWQKKSESNTSTVARHLQCTLSGTGWLWVNTVLSGSGCFISLKDGASFLNYWFM